MLFHMFFLYINIVAMRAGIDVAFYLYRSLVGLGGSLAGAEGYARCCNVRVLDVPFWVQGIGTLGGSNVVQWF